MQVTGAVLIYGGAGICTMHFSLWIAKQKENKLLMVGGLMMGWGLVVTAVEKFVA